MDRRGKTVPLVHWTDQDQTHIYIEEIPCNIPPTSKLISPSHKNRLELVLQGWDGSSMRLSDIQFPSNSLVHHS
jgi:hypothetical protein